MTDRRSALRLAPALAEPTPAPQRLHRNCDVLGLLAAGIPLTLLIDLASPVGPDSRTILDAESVEVQMSRSA